MFPQKWPPYFKSLIGGASTNQEWGQFEDINQLRTEGNIPSYKIINGIAIYTKDSLLTVKGIKNNPTNNIFTITIELNNLIITKLPVLGRNEQYLIVRPMFRLPWYRRPISSSLQKSTASFPTASPAPPSHNQNRD